MWYCDCSVHCQGGGGEFNLAFSILCPLRPDMLATNSPRSRRLERGFTYSLADIVTNVSEVLEHAEYRKRNLYI